jgi:hypothetical protein
MNVSEILGYDPTDAEESFIRVNVLKVGI